MKGLFSAGLLLGAGKGWMVGADREDYVSKRIEH
jgi:hypothetical protein